MKTYPANKARKTSDTQKKFRHDGNVFSAFADILIHRQEYCFDRDTDRPLTIRRTTCAGLLCNRKGRSWQALKSWKEVSYQPGSAALHCFHQGVMAIIQQPVDGYFWNGDTRSGK
jgi:hypothetical protein